MNNNLNVLFVLDVYMSLYEKLVPQTYSPMGEHFMDILMAINTRNIYL